jgi:hypothetical protein
MPHAREGAEMARKHVRFSHASHMPRVNGNCVRCHSDVAREDEVLRPKMASCLSCHAHKEQFKPEACEVCHVDLGEERVLPQTHLVHEGDFIREHGNRAASARDLCATCHTERSCAACHGKTTPALPAVRAFDDPFRASVHRAGFRARHSEEARAQPGLCVTCHSVSSCSDCHNRSGVGVFASNGAPITPSRSPHPPGWVAVGGENGHGRAARLDPLACASCHGGAGEALCVTCHRSGGIGGSPHPPGFASDRQKARDMPCRMCHQGAM